MKSTVHACYNQHLNENKPRRCRCRQKMSLAEATRQVEKGFAQWVILSQTLTKVKEPCPICNESIQKGCQNCQGTGEVERTHPYNVLGTDIVLVTAGSADGEGRVVYKPVKALKTPRVATIEKAHIYRAYVDGDKEEAERIEAYGLMTLEARIEMGIKPEPADDPKTGTGRNYDTGRSPFARIADERTSIGGIGKRIGEGFRIADEDALKGKD